MPRRETDSGGATDAGGTRKQFTSAPGWWRRVNGHGCDRSVVTANHGNGVRWGALAAIGRENRRGKVRVGRAVLDVGIGVGGSRERGVQDGGGAIHAAVQVVRANLAEGRL